MKYIAIMYVLVIITVCTGWVKNFNKLLDCDFEAPYKCEVVHLIGLFPPIGAITGWINTDTK